MAAQQHMELMKWWAWRQAMRHMSAGKGELQREPKKYSQRLSSSAAYHKQLLGCLLPQHVPCNLLQARGHTTGKLLAPQQVKPALQAGCNSRLMRRSSLLL